MTQMKMRLEMFPSPVVESCAAMDWIPTFLVVASVVFCAWLARNELMEFRREWKLEVELTRTALREASD